MRKLLVAAVTAATALSSLAFTEGAETDRGAPGAYVTGSVELPTRFTDATSGWPGLARRVHECSVDANGVIGYVLPLYEESWGGEFELRYTGDTTGIGDLDVLFYEDLGDCSGQGAPIQVGPYYDAHSDASGEVGIVPERARYAIVYMATGAQATFEYEDWEAPVVEVGDSAVSIPVTIRRGGDLRIENVGSTYLQIDAPGDSYDRLGEGRGLPIGEELRVTFNATGTFDVLAGDTTITVTVVD